MGSTMKALNSTKNPWWNFTYTCIPNNYFFIYINNFIVTIIIYKFIFEFISFYSKQIFFFLSIKLTETPTLICILNFEDLTQIKTIIILHI